MANSKKDKLQEDLDEMEAELKESYVPTAQDIIKDKNLQIKILEQKLSAYEKDGVDGLYYSLNRKANEMSRLLNNTVLDHLDLSDPKDKTFERIQSAWSDAQNLAKTVIALKGMISNPIIEDKSEGKEEIKEIPKVAYTPEMVADEVGELAGKKE
jgi:hypothetical protein